MSYIYSKVPIEKNLHSQNFDFLSLKICHQVSFWGAPTHVDITEFFNFSLPLENQMAGSKTVCVFSNILILKRIMTF